MTEVYTDLIMILDLIRSNLYVVRNWHCNGLWFVMSVCAKMTTETKPFQPFSLGPGRYALPSVAVIFWLSGLLG